MSDKDTRNSARRGRQVPGMAPDDDMLAPSSDPDALLAPETDSSAPSERTVVFRNPTGPGSAHNVAEPKAPEEEPPPSADATVIRMKPERPEPKRAARKPAPAPEPKAPEEEPPPSADATVIRMKPEPPASRSRASAPAARSEVPLAEKETLPPASAPALRPESRNSTSGAMARADGRGPASGAQPRAEGRNTAGGAMARSEPRAPAARPADAGSSLSAAEKARRRREAGETVGGQLSLWWGDMSPKGRTVSGVLLTGFVVGLLAALFVVFRPKFEQRFKGAEPESFGAGVLKDSFGLGEGVDWEDPDMKAFSFDFVSPTRAVAVVRYHAIGISKDEVSITLNAVNVGWIPPDTTNSAERELQQILSPSILKRGGQNQITFDNVRNPPGQDSWRIWNLRLEVIPVPNLPAEQLLESARTSAQRARAFYERKTVGRENLLLAWENFRSAWITLEALDEKPDLYEDVRHMLGIVSLELDQKCGQLLLDFQRNIQLKENERAAQVLEEINLSFPTTSHRCHNVALEKARQYEL
jgi:hypothetical protein